MAKKLSAQQRLMIQRRKWINRGFAKNEYEQFEQDVFNGLISRDIADNLEETKKTLLEMEKTRKTIEESNRKARKYFLFTVIVATLGIVITIILGLIF